MREKVDGVVPAGPSSRKPTEAELTAAFALVRDIEKVIAT